MIDDAELLRRYATSHDEDAFAELVRRHLNLVFRAALRQCGGDAHGAQDVTQVVFTLLARKGSTLVRHPSLTGWLFTTTHFTVRDVHRVERRRALREREVLIMQEPAREETTAADWERLRPLLDDAMQALAERDRIALLWRFFEGQSFARIAARLSLTEDAARMRVERALDKLRALLARRGVTSTSAALAVMLTSEAAITTPISMAANVTGSALALAASTAGSVAAPQIGAATFLSMNAVKSAAAGVLAIAAITTVLVLNGNRSEPRLQMAETNGGIRRGTSTQVPELVQPVSTPHVLSKAGAISTFDGGGWTNADALIDRGKSSPKAALETFLFAQRTADVEKVLDTMYMAPQAKEKADRFFSTLTPDLRAKFGTPARLVASFLVAGNAAMDSAKPGTLPPVSHRIVDEQPGIVGQDWPLALGLKDESASDPNYYTFRTNRRVASGRVSEPRISFYHADDGWRLILAPSLIDAFARDITRPVARPAANSGP